VAHAKNRRSVLLSFKFIGASLVGSLTLALVCTFAPPAAQIAVLGAYVSTLVGLFVSYVEQEDDRERRRAELLGQFRVPLALAPHHDLFDQYTALTRALTDLAGQTDPVLRQHALLQLSVIAEQVRSLAAGKIVFTATETWRIAYEQLLQSPGLAFYKSVAWVKTKDYWQDQPGRQAMRLNHDLARRGLSIDRILILRGDLWPATEWLPSKDVFSWIEEQHACGIRISLLRESEIISEPDLLCDFGIYGERATGIEDLDEQSRTIRFTLLFDRSSLALARDRWMRLSLYGKAFGELLARAADASPECESS
jgi:hypothetical protein